MGIRGSSWTGRNSSRGHAFAILAIAALAFWWPVLADVGGRVAGGTGDPLLVAYLVSWVAGHLGDPVLWHPPFFHPAGNVLAYSEHLIGLGIMAWPAVKAGVSPIVIVNLISIGASVLTSVALYWWLRDLRYDEIPSAAAAVCVTYGAWRLQQFAHPHQLFTPFLPVALVVFARVIDRRVSPWAVAVGSAALVAQFLCAPSLTIYMLPLVALWITVVSWQARRKEWRHWLVMAAALAVVVLANVPVAVHYWNVGAGITRDPIEIARFSVSWGDWISAPPTHWLYGNRLGVAGGAERELFPGIGFVVVLVLGLWWWVHHRDRVDVIAGAVTAATAIWLSTGLATSVFEVPLHWPYELLYRYVPSGDNIRVPARFVVVAALFLAPVLAAGWQAVHDRVNARLPARWATVGLLVLIASVATEALARPAWFEVAPDLHAEALPRGVESRGVLFLPLAEAVGPFREVQRMWMARTSRVAVVNGYSGNVSPLYARLRTLQRTGTDEGARRALYSWLRHVGVDTMVIEGPSPALFDPSLLEPLARNVYRIPNVAPPAFDTAPMGHGVGLIAAQDGWSYPERDTSDSWVWSTSRRAALVIPMDGRPRQTLSLRASSLVPSPLEVWWNGMRLGVQPLGLTPGWLDFPIPPEAGAAGWSAFEVVGPEPTAVPGSPDPRRLGVSLFEIRVR